VSQYLDVEAQRESYEVDWVNSGCGTERDDGSEARRDIEVFGPNGVTSYSEEKKNNATLQSRLFHSLIDLFVEFLLPPPILARIRHEDMA